MREMRWLWIVAIVAGCSGTYDLDGGDQIAVGEQFVAQRGCAKCHQSPNAADGILSGQTTPVPTTMAFGSNLTPDHATGIGDWADIEIVRAMRSGVDHQQQPLCPAMPHYDGTDATPAYHEPMTDLEANAIVAYLRSLPPVTRLDGGIPASMCPPIKPPPQDSGVAVDLAVPDLAAPPLDGAAPPDGGAGD
jgi:hypothetical protein